MKIIIDQNTNKILRYGTDVTLGGKEYMIKRDVDLSVWIDYEIFYNKLRNTFKKGDKISFLQLEVRIKTLEDTIGL